jgi:putative hydrolase of the HAD superfamily
MRYKLICFDAGFTLIKPRRTTRAALAEVLRGAGHPPFSEELLARAWGVADRWFWQEYHRPDNDTWSSDERIRSTWLRYHGLMLGDLGIDDADQRLAAAVHASHAARDNWELYADVRPALARLSRPGLTLGVVSDWSSELPDVLDALGIGQHFSFVLASAAAGAAKPAATFYQLALRLAGVTPREALMVGDSYAADVLGARAAGMDAVLIDRRGAPPDPDVPVIHELTELETLLAQ